MVTFGGETGLFKPDIDIEQTNSEWKIFRLVQKALRLVT